MNAFELLKADHEKVSGIFDEIEPTTNRASKTRQQLFTELKNELDIHSQIEEQILYPALKDADETHEITLEAFEEHHVVKQLLKDLAKMPVESDEWAAKLKVLKENVEHHVEEEEGEMFRSAREILGREQLAELGAQMEAEKKRQEQKSAAARS